MGHSKPRGTTWVVEHLLRGLETDRDGLASRGDSAGEPIETLAQRAYALGRAEGIGIAARLGPGDETPPLEQLWELLRDGRALYRHGGNERESRLVRNYVKGLWQGISLSFLELHDEERYRGLIEATDRFRLERGETVEAEIDVESTRVREEWWKAETATDLERLVAHSARLAILVDVASQKARDRLVLLVSDLLATTRQPDRVVGEARSRLARRAEDTGHPDSKAYLRRQAFTHLSQDQFRGLLPRSAGNPDS
jgi:hypothetical protein